MTIEEENRLAAAAKAGDREAMEALLAEFGGWLRRLAARHARRRRTSFDDAYQEACILFLGVVRSNDPGRGASFRSYVLSFLPPRMLDIPRGHAVTINRSAARHANRRGDGTKVLAAMSRPTRIEPHAADLRPGAVGDIAAPEPEPEHPHAWAAADSVERLPANYDAIIRGYYGFGAPARQLTDIARDLGVSASRATHIHKEALSLLRERIEHRLARHA